MEKHKDIENRQQQCGKPKSPSSRHGIFTLHQEEPKQLPWQSLQTPPVLFHGSQFWLHCSWGMDESLLRGASRNFLRSVGACALHLGA